MTVIVTRVDLFDEYMYQQPQSKIEQQHLATKQQSLPHAITSQDIEPFSFEFDKDVNKRIRRKCDVQVLRSNVASKGFIHEQNARKKIVSIPPGFQDKPNPFAPEVHDKYWSQRRRLFSKFDDGIELDTEGWYSVTPEVISDHVAEKLARMAGGDEYRNKQVCILEAFCGCGGNAVSFGKCPSIDLTVCIDIDRSKLRKAAHNASIYNIPKEKLIFIEANALTVLECYRNGDLQTEVQNKYLARNLHHRLLMSMMVSSSGSRPQHTETIDGYTIGGVELLPANIHGVHIDPPWGGVDYGTSGKNSYDLTRNLFVEAVDDRHQAFDISSNPTHRSESESLDGRQLLALVSDACNKVVYSLPRNTNKACIGQAALRAGYRGNVEFEEQFLNGRLKCISAYFGQDFRSLVLQEESRA
eukprot:CAMPEP_0196809904 /NCGR_PEP_ID=MMETSP1362-20130617/9769_1 /TAXON_ID=163516 /ORGANISM="Leptocylindrus danicus, Strain CCMP1856" /LENGTH=413 /DNA_ID=CAMNT_0042184735 /DNA_START=63 /DNA_END=1307 /DNA_ORIENTATION=+